MAHPTSVPTNGDTHPVPDATAGTRSLSEFIRANTVVLLADWETFARSLFPGNDLSPLALRDHAEQMLKAVADDMAQAQTAGAQESKAKGHTPEHAPSLRLAAEDHALTRMVDQFTVNDLIAEFRALRASVLRRWAAEGPATESAVVELTRFNESIDQALSQSVALYAAKVEEARSIIIGVLAHDLRNPLTAISVSADLILRDGDTAKPSHVKAATRIARSASAMTALVRDLLDYTRARLGQTLPINKTPADLTAIAEDALAEVEAANPSSSIAVIGARGIRGEWDAGRLRQVLCNLLTNAVIHGESATPVVVRIFASDDEATVEVHNSGTPIPEATLPTLFQPLKRPGGFGAPRKHGSSGLGLGLFIAHQIATAHGGDLSVKSTVEAGTTFRLALPMA